MAYSLRLFDSLATVDASAWDSVWDADQRYVFMHRGFLRAVESSMRASTRLRYVLVHDEAGRAVCAACLATFTLYLPDLAAGIGRSVLSMLPARLARIPFLFCGLPVSAAQRNIAFTPDCDPAAAVRAIDEALSAVAAEDGARLICFKEFDPTEASRLSFMESLGYCRFETPPTNVFAHGFTTFDRYLAALRSNHRKMVRASLRHLEQAGATAETWVDADAIAGIYTDRVHALYLDVVGRSETRLEVLPREFFLSLSREVPGVRLLTVRHLGEIVGFTWSLKDGDGYHILFAGLDYRRNEDLHLYFNLLYRTLDDAFRQHCRLVNVGQTADYFKARVGCTLVPRIAFARGRGRFMSWLFRTVLVKMMPPPTPVPPFHVFRPEVSALTETGA